MASQGRDFSVSHPPPPAPIIAMHTHPPLAHPQCGPCKAVSPRFEALAAQYKHVTFLKVDVDQLPAISQECQVRAMPTFQLYRQGRQLGEVVGADIARVEGLVRQHAAAGGAGGAGFPATGGRTLGAAAAAGGARGARGAGAGAVFPALTRDNALLGALLALIVYLWLNNKS
jgi:thioredoxin 1